MNVNDKRESTKRINKKSNNLIITEQIIQWEMKEEGQEQYWMLKLKISPELN